MVENIEAYCMKCKAKCIMDDAKLEIKETKSGSKRYMMAGKCTKCGTKMCKFISANDAPQ